MAFRSDLKRRDLVLAIIAMCAEREEFGRTALQKTAFFVSECLGAELGHRAHYYGPFSDQVECDVEDLVFAGLVEEQMATLSFAGHGAHQARRYEYRLTEDGRARVNDLEVAYPDDISALRNFIGRLVAAAGGLDQRILSPAAKTYFIAKREGRSISTSEIRQLAKKLGWDLRPPQIKIVAEVLGTLKLAKLE